LLRNNSHSMVELERFRGPEFVNLNEALLRVIY